MKWVNSYGCLESILCRAGAVPAFNGMHGKCIGWFGWQAAPYRYMNKARCTSCHWLVVWSLRLWYARASHMHAQFQLRRLPWNAVGSFHLCQQAVGMLRSQLRWTLTPPWSYIDPHFSLWIVKCGSHSDSTIFLIYYFMYPWMMQEYGVVPSFIFPMGSLL